MTFPALRPAGLLSALLLLSACGEATSDPEPAATPVAEPSPAPVICEPWTRVETKSEASFRGLSAASDSDIWVSGTGGTVGRSADGGASWSFMVVPGASELDFRDIDAFPDGVAYAMSAGPGEASQIHKTDDGGITWSRQFLNTHEAGFLDGLAFWDSERGLAYGDPVDGAFFLLRTEDAGETWERVPPSSLPTAEDGEAGFAASGSGLAVHGDGLALFGSGGAAARIFRSTDYGVTWKAHATPLVSGESSKGVFSVALLDSSRAIAVGGDYQAPETAEGNAAFSVDGGITWSPAATAPSGYRSAVAHAADGVISVGTAGADLSKDGGQTWTAIDPSPATALNVLATGEGPCAVWAAGPDGILVRWLEKPGS